MTDVLLQAKGLTKLYAKRAVVRNVTIEVDAGHVVGLLGPNGAGKTTTFSMIMGLIRPDRGRIRLRAEDITDLPVSKRARLGVGYLSQEPSVFRKLSVRDNVLAVLEWVPDLTKGQRWDRMQRILEDMGLAELSERRAELLSGGERRRLEISRILVTEPKLILLDEPFAAIDPIAVEELQRLVVDLKARGMGILITDHNVRETLSITDRSYIIHEGRILQSGPPDELVADERVRRTYLGQSFEMPATPPHDAASATESDADQSPDV